MTRQKKSWLLLTGLLFLWGIVLWGQLSGESGEAHAASPAVVTAATVDDTPSSLDPVVSPSVVDSVPIAPNDRLEAQARRANLPWGTSPFCQDPKSASIPSAPTPPRAVAPPPHTATRVSSILIGGDYRCAVIGGRRYLQGDLIPNLGTVTFITENSVELRTPQGETRTLSLASWQKAKARP